MYVSGKRFRILIGIEFFVSKSFSVTDDADSATTILSSSDSESTMSSDASYKTNSSSAAEIKDIVNADCHLYNGFKLYYNLHRLRLFLGHKSNFSST